MKKQREEEEEKDNKKKDNKKDDKPAIIKKDKDFLNKQKAKMDQYLSDQAKLRGETAKKQDE